MISLTSSTNINVGTRLDFLPGSSPPRRRAKIEEAPSGLSADYDNPSPEEIERLTKQIIDEILRGLPEAEVDPPPD